MDNRRAALIGDTAPDRASPAFDFLFGGDEMSALIRATDRSKTAIIPTNRDAYIKANESNPSSCRPAATFPPAAITTPGCGA